MAQITFLLNGKDFVCNPNKLERSKVYGSTEKIIRDERGELCKQVSMDQSGTIIIPKGGIGMGILDEDNNWITRSQLVAVNSNGEKIEQIPSSFTAPIQLNNKVSVEHFLDHSISSVYELPGDNSELIQLIGNDIYTFDFNYRTSYDTNPAFLLANAEGLFMIVGFKNNFEFISLQEVSVVDAEEEVEETDEFDIDFSMM